MGEILPNSARKVHFIDETRASPNKFVVFKVSETHPALPSVPVDVVFWYCDPELRSSWFLSVDSQERPAVAYAMFFRGSQPIDDLCKSRLCDLDVKNVLVSSFEGYLVQSIQKMVDLCCIDGRRWWDSRVSWI